MEHATVGDVTLEYESVGSGEPVVFIHGGFMAGTFRTLIAVPKLKDYRLITYTRRGYAGSTHTGRQTTVAQHAADCAALMAHLRIPRAHVVGHSYGGSVALQLALDVPEVVHSLTLLETALLVGDSAASYAESIAHGRQRYEESGAEVAIDEALRARWPEYRDHIDHELPGAFAAAIADAETTFRDELPTLLEWRFGEAEARRVNVPALVVLGERSNQLWPRFGETHRSLMAWLPRAEEFILPGATHFLQIENPQVMAEGLSDFLGRHPLGD